MECKFTVLRRKGVAVDHETVNGQIPDAPEAGRPVIVYMDSYSEWLTGFMLVTDKVRLIQDIDTGWIVGTTGRDVYKIELAL